MEGERRAVLAGSAAATAALLAVWLGARGAAPVPVPATARVPPPDPDVLAGARVYAALGCAGCHGPGGKAVRRRPPPPGAALLAHVREKALPAGDAEKGLRWLSAYLEDLGEGGTDLSALPAGVRRGGEVIAREDCRQCHLILGDGGRRGPALAGVGARHERGWLVTHFLDPKGLVPGSRMPSYRRLPRTELDAMTDYLAALP